MKKILEWLAVVAGFVALIAWCALCLTAAIWPITRLPINSGLGGLLMLPAAGGALWFALRTAKALSQKRW